MAQLPGFREQIHEEKYDTLIRGVGTSTISQKTKLFRATAALYRYIEDGLMWTLNVGNKPMLGALPLFVAPGGGGMFGHDVNSQAHVITNGVPSWEAVMKLAKPVKIEKNQHFSVDVEFYDFASLDAAVTTAIDPRAQLNADTGLKIVKCFLGGILERAVQ